MIFFQVLRYLYFSNVRLQRLANSTFYGLEETLKILRFRDCNLQDIPPAVRVLQSLDALTVQGDDIREVRNFRFLGLGNLKSLRLLMNNITIIHEKAFEGLLSLKILDLSNNPLRVLNGLQDLSTLDQLILLEVSVPILLHDTVRDLNLKTLVLSSTARFRIFPDLQRNNTDWLLCKTTGPVADNEKCNSTEGLTKFISLRGKLELEPGNFQHLTSLESMQLRSNFSHLPSYLFCGLCNLKFLNLVNNAICHIQNDVFVSLPKLEYLLLQSNRIHSIDSHAFSKLVALRELNLNTNMLTVIHDGMFNNLSALSKLQLNYNKISRIHKYAFNSLKVLKTLQLLDNPIKVLDGIQFTPSVTNLEVSRTFIDDLLYSQFSNKSKLEKLKLTESSLSSFFQDAPDIAKRLTGIETQNETTTTENEISDTCPTFFTLSKLSKLSYLDLSGNNLILHPQNFIYLPQLLTLKLRSNNISTLPFGVFCGLSKLKYLTLHHNNLKHIPRLSFYNLTKLESLILSLNQIEVIATGAFTRLERLRILTLIGNRLQIIPGEVLTSMPGLSILYVTGNPLHCDCTLHTRRESLIKKVTDHKMTRCFNKLMSTITNFTDDGCFAESDTESNTVIPQGKTTKNGQFLDVFNIVILATSGFLLVFTVLLVSLYWCKCRKRNHNP